MANKTSATKTETYFWILLALVFITSLTIQYFTLPSHDHAWFFLITQHLLQGDDIYREFLDPNMPLIFWLYSGPIALANHLGADPATAVKFAAVGLIALSLFLCARVLKHSSQWQGDKRSSLLLAIAGILLFSANSYIVFAQREHLVVVFALPYLLLNLPSVSRQKISTFWQIGLGALAGLGFCLKPHFVVIWLVVLAYRYIWSGSLRSLFAAADIAIAVVSAVYLSAIVLFVPHYFDLISIVSQLYHSVGYFGETINDKIVFCIILTLIIIGVSHFFGLLRLSKEPWYTGDTHYLFWAMMGAYLETLLQFKNWSYIYYPVMALGGIAVVTVILLKPLTNFMALVFMAWLFYPLTPLSDNRHDINMRRHVRIMEALKPYEHSRDFYFISLSSPTPEFYTQGQYLAWGGRFHRFYMLDGIMEPSPVIRQPTLNVRPGKEQLERWVRDNLVEDLEEKKPDLIVVDRQWLTNRPFEATFDFMAWFKKDPRLVKIFKNYEFRKKAEVCFDALEPNVQRCTYSIYIRKPMRKGRS